MTERQKELAFLHWWTEIENRQLPMSGPKLLLLNKKLLKARTEYDMLRTEQEIAYATDIAFQGAKKAWMAK